MFGIQAVVAACLLISAGSAVGTDVALPSGSDRITTPWKPENSRSGTPVIWKKVNDRPFDQVAEITVKEVPAQPYHRQLILPVTGPIERSDVLHLRFWARTVGATKLGKISVVVEEDREPWEKILQDRAFRLDSQWRQLDIRFVAGRTFTPGASAVKIRLGFKEQQLQIGGVALHNFGQGQVTPDSLPHSEITYPGRSENAPWRKAAQRRIEKHRKSKLTVRVLGPEGDPVEGARVGVAMQRHAFGFGTAVQPQLLLDRPPQSNRYGSISKEDWERYREILKKHFNKVVFEHGFRWHQWFQPRRQGRLEEHLHMLDQAMNWCAKRAMPIRGHYLSWATMNRAYKFPDDYEAHPERLWPDLKAHIERKLAFTDGRIPEWDAVNHIIGWGPTTFADVTGSPEIYAKTIRLGRQLTDAEMWINEGHVVAGSQCRDDYLAMVDQLAQRDAKPDGVGFMAHFAADQLISPQEIYSIFDQFAAKGVQLQLTELDVAAGGDEQLQSDFYRDVITAAFSHPAMEGVVLWGFWEGRHWRPETALWRKDWSIKPSGEIWQQLIHEKWWTDTEAKTNDSGEVQVNGFHGTYAITVHHEGRTKRVSRDLTKGGNTVVIRFQ